MVCPKESSTKKSERFSISIDDSYCPSCLAAIAPELLKHEGITKVTMLHAEGQIIAEYDPDRISFYTLKDALESAIVEHIEDDGGSRSAMDPVCQMLVKTGEGALYSDHNNQRYYFCTLSCKRAFEEDPAAFEDITLIQ
jgi:YHS domain-containing protein/copper chaperone CopZ